MLEPGLVALFIVMLLVGIVMLIYAYSDRHSNGNGDQSN